MGLREKIKYSILVEKTQKSVENRILPYFSVFFYIALTPIPEEGGLFIIPQRWDDLELGEGWHHPTLPRGLYYVTLLQTGAGGAGDKGTDGDKPLMRSLQRGRR